MAGRPLILFNLLISIEWAADASYTREISQAARLASDYLLDISDGQMALGHVAIYTNAERWDHAEERARDAVHRARERDADAQPIEHRVLAVRRGVVDGRRTRGRRRQRRGRERSGDVPVGHGKTSLAQPGRSCNGIATAPRPTSESHVFRRAHPIAARALGDVQRLVGDLEEATARLGVLGVSRHADRALHLELAELGLEDRLAQLLAHALGELQRALGVGLLAEHAELLTAEARHAVGVALHAEQDRAELLDDHVARRVPVGVVHLLEVIDVEEDAPPRPDAEFVQLCASLGLTSEESPFVDPTPELAEVLVAGQHAGHDLIEQLSRGGETVNGWRSAVHMFDYNLDFTGPGTIDDPSWKSPDRTTAYMTRAVVAREVEEGLDLTSYPLHPVLDRVDDHPEGLRLDRSPRLLTIEPGDVSYRLQQVVPATVTPRLLVSTGGRRPRSVAAITSSRQMTPHSTSAQSSSSLISRIRFIADESRSSPRVVDCPLWVCPVSYTHLTLPTSDLV